MHRSARLSPCGRYRYSLTRRWANTGGLVCFVMLNPSTADAVQDDPTIRRCIAFARRWRARGLYVVNLFALRATDPRDLKRTADPFGPQNAAAIISACRTVGRSGRVVCAWGGYGSHRDADTLALSMVRRCGVLPWCLGVTKGGQPKHPLYLPSDTGLVPFECSN